MTGANTVTGANLVNGDCLTCDSIFVTGANTVLVVSLNFGVNTVLVISIFVTGANTVLAISLNSV